MRIAAAAYNMDFLDNWQAYEDKLTRWVSDAAGQGAELLVFPEYGAMELATLAGREAAADLEASLHAVSDRMADAAALHATLAARHKLHILAASAPVFDGGSRPVNRAMVARNRLVEMASANNDPVARTRWLREIVAADASAGAERTDETRLMAAESSLALGQIRVGLLPGSLHSWGLPGLPSVAEACFCRSQRDQRAPEIRRRRC